MSRRRRPRGWRLVPAAAAAWSAAGLATLAPDAAAPGAWVAAVLVAVGMAWMLRRPGLRRGIGPVAGLVALAAVASVCGHVAGEQPERAAVARLAEPGRAVVLEAVVTGRVAASASGDVWFDASAAQVRVGERVGGAGAPVRVGVPAAHVAGLGEADLGAVVVVRGIALPPDPGDRAAVVVRASSAVEVRAVPDGLFGVLAALRRGLVASAARLPAPGGALVPGLAIGDTSAVDARLDAAMAEASLSHLTAVSGANCAIVIGIAFALAALCGAPRAARVGVALAALVLFVLLVTPEPSVVRAAAMAAIAMLGLLLGRAGAGLAALALAVVVLLVVDPWLAGSLGFALSVAATAALLVLARPLAAGMARVLPRPLALAISVPLAAQLACAPLLVLVDPRVPLLGVLANLVAAPAAPLATVTGFLGALASPLPWLQDGLVGIAWVPASWIAGVADAVTRVPGQLLPWLEGMPGALTLALVCAAAGAALALPDSGGRGVRSARMSALLTVGVVVGVGGGQVAVQTVAGPWTVPPAWRLAACDVGQGDAMLVRSAGVVALIDAGPEPGLLDQCLRRFGIDRIDLLVLTHFDLDHVGGVPAIAGRVATVLHGPADPGERALGELAAGGAELVRVEAGREGTLGAARWRVLWPAASVHTPGNDASVVLELTGDDLPHTVMLGDLSAEPQARLRSSVGDVDVVKVAHHGSADQDPGLYERLDAELALVTVGEGNDYGHPRDSLLSMLIAQGAAIARTDTDGALAAWREDGGLRVWTDRGVAGAG